MYFVITNLDGETFIDTLTEEELENKLNENYWGGDPIFMNSLGEDDKNTNNWEEGTVLIIKGETIMPSPVETVTKWRL